MSRDELQPEFGRQLTKSDATSRIRRECSQAAKQQGGTELTKNHAADETALPAGDAVGDIAGDERNAGGSGMGSALGEWQYRDDEGYDDGPTMADY
jgi:hypothetical protein